MKLDNYHKIVNNTPPEVEEYVNLSMDILDRIHELLDEKFDGKQKLLAERLGKSEAEVSKWLSGVQNFTIRTLAKLHTAFGEPVIAVCTGDNESIFEQVKTPYGRSQVSLVVDRNGGLRDEEIIYHDINRISGTESLNPALPA